MNDNNIYSTNPEEKSQQIYQALKQVDAEYPSRPLTDVGNSLRFTELATGKLLWVPEAKMWFYWDGLHWCPDELGVMYNHYVFKVYQQILDESKAAATAAFNLIADHEDGERKTALEKQYQKLVGDIVKWWTQSQGQGHYFAMGTLGAEQISMAMQYRNFDCEPNLIGVTNGILNIETFEVLTGESQHLVTKSVGAEYHPNAVCPNWNRFIQLVTEGNNDEAEFLQRLAGVCMLGVPKDKLVILHGESGANGKTTFAETLCMLLGDYGQKCPTRMLLQDNSNKEYYLADLKGKRMVSMHEVKADAHLAGDLIKMLLDSGTIVARKIRGEPFSFTPIFTPILTVNKMPGMGAEDALWRRVIVMEFKCHIPESERNTNFIEDRLKQEFSGILNWCLAGLVQYRLQGLNPPRSVIENTAKEKDEQDKMKQFIEEICVTGAQYKVPLAVLRKHYGNWCSSNVVRMLGLGSIKSYLASKGYQIQYEGARVATVYGLKVDQMRMLG